MRLLTIPILLVACLAGPSYAALDLRVQPASFVEGTPVGTVDIFISSDNADEIAGMRVDFRLPDGGSFSDPPGVFGETEPGFFGFGTLNAASDFRRDTLTEANLSLDFTTATAPPASEILLARASVVLTGLVPGTYSFNMANALAFTASASDIPIVPTNGTITITAVPEPTGLGAVLFGCAAIVSSRRRRK